MSPTDEASDPPVEIRTPSRRELAGVAPLAGGLVRLHHSLDPKRFFVVEPVERGYERYLASQLNLPETVFLAAFCGGEVLGYAFGATQPRDWMLLLDACGVLHDLFVAPSARRRGVGARLLEAVLRRFEEMKVAQVVLNSAWGNADAQRLFERYGFRRTMVEMTREL